MGESDIIEAEVQKIRKGSKQGGDKIFTKEMAY